jgi:hypothetical protein
VFGLSKGKIEAVGYSDKVAEYLKCRLSTRNGAVDPNGLELVLNGTLICPPPPKRLPNNSFQVCKEEGEVDIKILLLRTALDLTQMKTTTTCFRVDNGE